MQKAAYITTQERNQPGSSLVTSIHIHLLFSKSKLHVAQFLCQPASIILIW